VNRSESYGVSPGPLGFERPAQQVQVDLYQINLPLYIYIFAHSANICTVILLQLGNGVVKKGVREEGVT
jgi:hypothetical protein